MPAFVTLLICAGFITNVATLLHYGKDFERNGIHATVCMIAVAQLFIGVCAIVALMAGGLQIELINPEGVR